MRDRLYRVYCFWRDFGTKAVVRLVLHKAKLRAAPPLHVPAVPAPTQAVREGEASALVELRFQATTPLRVYSTPGEGLSRVTMITDTIKQGAVYGGVGTAMIMAALIAENLQRRLRIVTRIQSPQPSNLEHVLSTYGITLTRDPEFIFAPFYDRRYEMDVFDDELFVTTSWWTTAATMASVAHESVLYLLQEDERMFYPYGDERLRCAQVLDTNSIRYVVNTRLLYDHLVASGMEHLQKTGICFEPAFPASVFHPRPRAAPAKRKFLFYARPNNLRNLFYFGVDVIEQAVRRSILDLEDWDIVLVGKDIPGLTFGDGYVPEKYENLAWQRYADLIGSVDLGLCLMYTPHPSYPPLDLAASGAVVVTNRCGNKQDLSGFSRNIVLGNLERESMLEALAEGVRLAKDEAARTANFGANGLVTDWRSALADVIAAAGRR